MSKVAIVTDSNSGITQEQGKELGIFVLPMPFFIDGELYLEDITLSQSEFYEKLGADSDISTSQPSPGEVMDLWDKVLEEYDELVCIPMSSGLSSTCATAITLAAEYDGRVQVVDNQRISVTQEQSVLDAMNLREEGKSAAEIKEILEKEKLQASIYITVDTLKYLKKGGRITPAAAAIGTVLNLKPVLQIQGEKLDAFSKARGCLPSPTGRGEPHSGAGVGLFLFRLHIPRRILIRRLIALCHHRDERHNEAEEARHEIYPPCEVDAVRIG